MRDLPGHRDEAVPGTAAPTYRPHAGTWNTRTGPERTAPPGRYDPFAALGHDASRHGRRGTGGDAEDGDPTRSLWPHADDRGHRGADHTGAHPGLDTEGRAERDDGRRTAWTPHATWRPTPSVPFPRPAPPAEDDPTAWS